MNIHNSELFERLFLKKKNIHTNIDSSFKKRYLFYKFFLIQFYIIIKRINIILISNLKKIKKL